MTIACTLLKATIPDTPDLASSELECPRARQSVTHTQNGTLTVIIWVTTEECFFPGYAVIRTGMRARCTAVSFNRHMQ